MSSLIRCVMSRGTTLPRLGSVARYSSWNECTKILQEEDKKHPPPVSRKKFQSGNDVSFDKRTDRWKLFTLGQIIRPHDLTYKARINAPRTRPFIPPGVAPPTKVARANDIFYQLDLNPLSQAMNPSVLSQFLTELGKIQNRSRTRLTSKNQRKLAQAIRRARMMGVIPILSKPVRP